MNRLWLKSALKHWCLTKTHSAHLSSLYYDFEEAYSETWKKSKKGLFMKNR